MKVLEAIEKYKSNIIKIMITFTTMTFYICILYRIVVSNNQNQLFLTLDLYSM